MCAQLNSKYLNSYATEFAHLVCENYFMGKKFMTGQGIIQLTPSSQVNFFILKSLYEAWQIELEKLKSNPYFDYRSNIVHNALKDFMNVLSRSIKIERSDFEPLLVDAVSSTILLAVEPLDFFFKEFDKVEADQLNNYLKENRKYFKWHSSLVINLIDRAGLAQNHDAYKVALKKNHDIQRNELEPAESLLENLDQIIPFDLKRLAESNADIKTKDSNENFFNQVELDTEENQSSDIQMGGGRLEDLEENRGIQEQDLVDIQHETSHHKAAIGKKAIDPKVIWERFESEQYIFMRGSIGNLSENISINQRIMFTKVLFDGNPDLMKHALKSIDNCGSFIEAVTLLNEKFVGELKWDKDSEAVEEFLQLIFRKFDHKS